MNTFLNQENFIALKAFIRGRQIPESQASFGGKSLGNLKILYVFLLQCSPGYPGNHYVAQAGLELRDLVASNSGVQGICTTTAWFKVLT